MPNDFLFSGSPLRVADGIAAASVRHHGPAFLTRGGSVGRAYSELARGRDALDAASVGAKWGKGSAAEVMLASEHSLDAAIRELPFRTEPNKVSNARHADLEIFEQSTVADTVQVGTGSLAYLRRKALNSQAGQVVVPTDVKEVLRRDRRSSVTRIDDKVRFKGTTSRSLCADAATEHAQQILHREILGLPAVPEWLKWTFSIESGCAAAVDGFATGLLFEAVERFWCGRAFDSTMVERAIIGAGRAGLRTALATYIQVNEFLARARAAFSGRILSMVGRGVVWAGAIAEVVVSTAIEVWRWLKDQISFEELLRRAGVHGCTAVGGALGAAGALVVLRGAPPWLQIAGVLLAGWGGAAAGRAIGNELFAPAWNPRPTSE